MGGRRQTGQWVRLLLALALLSSPGASVAEATAQSEGPDILSQSPPGTTSSQAPPATALEAAAADPQDEKVDSERRRKLRIALLTGGLIAITGLALVLLTILGGSATRRGLRRKPLKEGTPPLEPIPAERFDEPDPDEPEANGSADEDRPGQDGGAR